MPQNNPQYRDQARRIEYNRIFTIADIRSEENTNQRALVGHAAVFDQVASIGGWYDEVLRRGCFNKTIQEYDQVALWNHDTGKPLARRSAKTLELREDEIGLWFWMALGDQSWADDAWISILRGDVLGMSFAFQTIRTRWTEKPGDENNLREILECRLYEVSPVTFPEYDGTDVSADQARAIIPSNLRKQPSATTAEPDAHHSGTPEPDAHHSDAGAGFDIRLARAIQRHREQKLKHRGVVL